MLIYKSLYFSMPLIWFICTYFSTLIEQKVNNVSWLFASYVH